MRSAGRILGVLTLVGVFTSGVALAQTTSGEMDTAALPATTFTITQTFTALAPTEEDDELTTGRLAVGALLAALAGGVVVLLLWRRRAAGR